MTAAAIQRDLRIEPAYPIETLSEDQRRALLATERGTFVYDKGADHYVLHDREGRPLAVVVASAVVNPLRISELLRRRYDFTSGVMRVELIVTGEGAHAIRTLKRRGV